MYYYKVTESDGSTSYEERFQQAVIPGAVELAKEVYDAEYAEFLGNMINEDESDAESYEDLQSRVTELENENAALLYENLTGEVFGIVQ